MKVYFQGTHPAAGSKVIAADIDTDNPAEAIAQMEMICAEQEWIKARCFALVDGNKGN